VNEKITASLHKYTTIKGVYMFGQMMFTLG